MIDLIFQYGPEIILVKVDGNSVLFGNTTYGAKLADIKGIKLSRSGVEKEFPDLTGSDNWREEAIKRFKEKISSMNNEREKAEYIIEDLRKQGYQPKRMQVKGRRPIGIK